MKKHLLLVLMITLLVILTGCGNKESNKNSVERYLDKYYANESFSIKEGENVKIKSATGNCDEVSGNTWVVTSNTTGLTFYVQDSYEYNSYSCNYQLRDNYFSVYLENFLDGLNDDRATIDFENSIKTNDGYGHLETVSFIKLDINEFSSTDDMAKFAMSLKEKLYNNSFIKKHIPQYFSYKIYNDDQLVRTIYFNKINSVAKFKDLMN